MTKTCPMCHIEWGSKKTMPMVLHRFTDFMEKIRRVASYMTVKATPLVPHMARNRVNEQLNIWIAIITYNINHSMIYCTYHLSAMALYFVHSL